MKKILFSAFGILFFWALFVPALEYPDEQAHLASVALLVETGQMPKGDQKDVSMELATLEAILGTQRDGRGNNKFTYHPEVTHQFSQGIYGPHEQDVLEANTEFSRKNYLFKEGARYPFLFYSYSGLFYKAVYEESILDRLFSVRFGVVLLGVANIFIAYKIGRELVDSHQYSLILASLVALQPMMVFVMSGVNSDALHNVIFSGILLYCLRLIKYKYAGDTLFYLSILFVLDLLTKPQAFIAIPIIALAFVLRMVWQKEIKSTLKYIIPLFVFGITFLFITKNPILFDFINEGKIPYINRQVHPEAPAFGEYAKYSLERLLHQNVVWFWGVFKWLGVVLPKPFWWLANRLVFVSALGLLWGFFKIFTREQKIKVSFLVGSVAVYIMAIFWFDWMYIQAHAIQVAVQARYYFPVFTALIALLHMGFLGFSAKTKYQDKISQFLVFFFVALQIGGIYTIAKSYYDLSSLHTLFSQASQYKPLFAKGVAWWMWGIMYLVGVGSILRQTFKKSD